MAKKATFEAWREDAYKRAGQDPEKTKALDTLLADEALKESLFGGNLREQDYYKRVNEVNEVKANLSTAADELKRQQMEWQQWYQDTQAEYNRVVAEKAELEKQIKYGAIEEPAEGASSKMTPRMQAELEELRKEVQLANSKANILDETTTRLIGDLSTITYEAVKSGLNVNPKEVLEYSYKNKVDPYSAFEVLTRPEREERDAERQKKLLDQAREEGRREAEAKSSPAFRLPSSAPSTADFFRTTPDLSDPNARTKAASDAYYKLLQQSGAA